MQPAPLLHERRGGRTRVRLHYASPFSPLNGPSPITAQIRFSSLSLKSSRIFPNKVIVLPCIEVHLAERVFSACEDHRKVEALGETSFVVHTSARATHPLCEVSHHEPTPADLTDDPIVDLVDMFFLVDS